MQPKAGPAGYSLLATQAKVFVCAQPIEKVYLLKAQKLFDSAFGFTIWTEYATYGFADKNYL
ncbi:MAG: hypothetical protein B5M56_05915 [Desulfococcus sp. 4484_241]|nr:MAG: hypothetical protein B5M56_05915 [Desulfococcus sp. 4484_241]